MSVCVCSCKEEEGEQSLKGACLPGNGGQENARTRWLLPEAPREEIGVFLTEEVIGSEELSKDSLN